MDNILVLIGDLVRSRELEPEQRRSVQQILEKTLSDISRQSTELLTPHTITLGDEFQAVYKKADDLLSDSWAVMNALHPVKVRFSFGIGTITTDLNREQAIGMDGPAFHAAREGMDELKSSGSYYQFTSKMSEREMEDPALTLINESLFLISRQMESWKRTRFSILHKLEKNRSIKEIAQQLDISETAVYKNRQNGSLDIILSMGRSIPRLVNERYHL